LAEQGRVCAVLSLWYSQIKTWVQVEANIKGIWREAEWLYKYSQKGPL
jgi:hypothetical protein